MAPVKYPCEIGEKFGRWEVLGEAPKRNRRRFWKCKCECGTIKNVSVRSLCIGTSKGCRKCNDASRVIDLLGKTFGEWLVIERDRCSDTTRWICKCSCGKTASVSTQTLVRGASKRCKLCAGYVDFDLTGKTYGSFTVVRKTAEKNTKCYWDCVCKCGRKRKIPGSSLRSQGVRNKCIYCHNKYIIKHGLSHHELYNTWHNMIRRCENKKTHNYDRYGGRGIFVCEEWHDLKNFVKDMHPKPSQKHSIDRINNDDGYYKENCRWALIEEQVSNTRSNVFETYLGKTLTVTQWSRELNISQTILRRYLKTHSIKEAFERYKK